MCIVLLRCLHSLRRTIRYNLAQALIVTIVKQEPTTSKTCWITFHVKILPLALFLEYITTLPKARSAVSSSTQHIERTLCTTGLKFDHSVGICWMVLQAKQQQLKQYVAMTYFAHVIDVKEDWKLEIPTVHNAF